MGRLSPAVLTDIIRNALAHTRLALSMRDPHFQGRAVGALAAASVDSLPLLGPSVRAAGAMSLAHALVTALLERPCSGAELARRFDRSIGYFWPATHQQIYRELARLELQGWVASDGDAARGRRRMYHALPKGRDALSRWVAEPREPKAIRDELMIKLRAEAVLADAGIEETLRLRLDRHRAKLANYREIKARSFADPHPSREQRLQRLILGAGIDLELLWIALCEDALAILADDA